MSRVSTIEGLRAMPASDDDMRDIVTLGPTDVVIAPYAKSGTTWMQQIVHTLRTRGDMDFDDISRMIPFLETNELIGLDLEAPQRGAPRAFKTHVPWEYAPRGGRYILVVRDPAVAAVSMFRFMEGALIERGAFTADDYVEHRFLVVRSYYEHLRSWWNRRDDPDVLYLVYEHMLRDPEATIRRVAGFIGIELDDALLAMTLEHSSRDFMLRHVDRFDDALVRSALGGDVDLAKVTPGSTDAALSPHGLGLLADAWRDEIERTLGYDSYDALAAAVH